MTLLGKTTFVLVVLAGIAACSGDADSSLRSVLREHWYVEQEEGSLERALEAVRAGANVHMSYKALRPIDVAVSFGHLELLQAVLDRGADPNAADVDSDGVLEEPPLLRCIEHGGHNRLAVVQALVAAGADVDGHPEYAAPLSLAAANGELEVVKFLVAAGADVGGHEDQTSAVFEAAAYGHLEVVEFLLSQDEGPNGKQDLLLAAVTSGNPRVVEEVLKVKPAGTLSGDPFELATDHLLDDNTAIAQGFTEILELLKASGLEPTPTSFDQALITSARLRRPDRIAMLLKEGASPNARDEKGETPQIALAKNCNWDPVESPVKNWQEALPKYDALCQLAMRHLLKNATNVNARDRQERTALMYAARVLSETLVSTLLEHGADPSLVDREGLDAAEHARQRKPKDPEKQDKMARVMMAAFGFSHELIHELRGRSDRIVAALTAPS